jgi:tetratricopeptide (TPR) repeat protein
MRCLQYVQATSIFLVLHTVVFAQGVSGLKIILELPSRDDQSISSEEIVKHCSDVLASRDKHGAETVAHALLVRGEVYYRLGKLGDALTDFDALCKLKPKMGQARSRRALTLAAMARMDDAINCAKEAVALEPKLAANHAALGELLRLQGKLDDALASAKTALEIDPDLAVGYYLCALIANAQGDGKESLKMVNRYLEKRPLPDLAEPDHPYLFRGWLLLGASRPADALNNFFLGRKLNPSSPAAALGILYSYSDLRKWHLSAKAAEQLVKLAPNVPEYHLYQSYAQAKIGANQPARKSMEEAVRRAVEPNAQFTAHKGSVHFLLGEYSLALECFDSALEVDKDCSVAIAGKSLMLATCAEAKYRDGAEARKLARRDYDQEKGKRPDHCSTFLLLADAEAECGNSQEALRLARKALEHAGPDREHGEFLERIKLFENKKPYRYVVPAN